MTYADKGEDKNKRASNMQGVASTAGSEAPYKLMQQRPGTTGGASFKSKRTL